MKKRITSLLMVLVFAFLGFCGCQNATETPNDMSSDVQSEVSDQTSTDNSEGSDNSTPQVNPPEENPQEPEEPEEPEEQPEPDFFTKHGHAELPKPSSIPESHIKTEIEHLYSLDIDLPDADGFNCLVNGDYMYLSFLKRDESLCYCYSLSTGELVGEFSLPSWNSKGLLNDGGIWSIDFSSLKIEFITPQGEKTLKYETAEFDEFYISDAIVTPDGKYSVISFGSQTSPCVVDISKGEKSQPKSLSLVDVNYTEMAGDKIRIRFSNGIGLYDPATDDFSVQTNKNGIGGFFGDLYVTPSENALILNSLNDSKRFYMERDLYEHLSDLKFGYVVNENFFDIRTYNFCNLRKGTIDASIHLSAECYGGYAELLDNGRALILEYFPDNTNIYIFDLPSAAGNIEAVEFESYLSTDEEISQLTKDIADRIYTDYGIEVLYSSQGNDFIIYDYVGHAELDCFKVYKAVKETEEILSKFPKNMLRETYENTHNGMRFYLCGTLYGVSGAGLDSAGAVTSEQDNYIIIAYDIDAPLEDNIPHELSHAFDRRINNALTETDIDWMEVWLEATPFEDAYTNSYEDYFENMDYTILGETKEENVWFIDEYARTFPTEDRARILEHLFNPEEGEIADFLQYENLVYKAKLYSYILRQCFPSCNGEEPLYWETYLGEIDDSVLPQE